MRRIYRNVSGLGTGVVIACVAVFSLASVGFAQTTTAAFRYVFPLFNSQAGSEIIIDNLSGKAVTAEISLLDSNTQTFVDSFQNIPARSQQRFAAASFGLSGFSGTVLINTNAPISTVVTLADGSGHFETVSPAVGADTVIVPFGTATDGFMDLTIFNPQTSATSVLLSVIAPDGSTIATGQATLPGLGTFSTDVNALVPQTAFSQQREISHVIVRALSNVLGPGRSVFVQGILNNFSDNPQGIVGPHFEPALINAVPQTGGTTTADFPFFIQGGDYSTVVQVINPSNAPISVNLTISGVDGNPLTSSPTITAQVPANGSVRLGLPNAFALPTGVQVGSLKVDSASPFIAVAALASVGQNGILVMPPADPVNTNFVFRTRLSGPQIFTGLAFRNPNSVAANVTISNNPDDGSGVSSGSLTIPPFALASKGLGELLPEALNGPGFVFVTSSVPLSVQAIEGRVDDSMLANLPAMHAQADFVAPAATKFFITGTVLHNGAALAGAVVQLNGPAITTTFTDGSGNYQFGITVPGQYTVSVADAGYTFSPASANVTISAASQRGINFTGTLITPTITAVQPPGVVAGTLSIDLVVAGGPFLSNSQIIFDGAPVATSLTSAGISVTVIGSTGGTTTVVQQQTVLKTTIGADKLGTARVTTVAIRNIGPGGSVTSATKTFSIGSVAPVLTQLDNVPSPLFVGNPGFTITAEGTGFVPGTSIVVQGTSLPTTFVSDTVLTAFVPGQLLVGGGILSVTVLKPQPTIGPSNILTIPITSPQPGVTSISPNFSEARLIETALPLQVTVNGFGFVGRSVVTIDDTEVPTQFVSSTQLIASIPQPQLESARVAIIRAKNPPPAVDTSHFDDAVPMTIYNPVPTVTSLDVSLMTYDGKPRFQGDDPAYPTQVVIHGTNFAKDNLARYLTDSPCPDKSGAFTGVRLSSTLVIGKINIACIGTYHFGFTNLQPGGGVSNDLSFTVNAYVPPLSPVVVQGLSPASVRAGASAFDLTIGGQNFASGAVVNFGTAVLTPSLVSPGTIVVNVPAYLVGRADLIPVSVSNPDLTGNSNSILFTVN